MRDWVFKQWWRVNHARGVISLFFWIAMFVGVWVPLVQIVVPIPKWVLVIIIGVVTFFFTLLIGYVWDKMGFWKEETRHMVRRNVAFTEPVEKERKYLVPLQLETAKEVFRLGGGENKKLEKMIKETEDWVSE